MIIFLDLMCLCEVYVMWVHTYKCVCTWMCVKDWQCMSSFIAFHLCLWDSASHWNRSSLFQLDFWASKLLTKNPPVSASPRAGVTGLCHHVPELYVRFRDPNSGLHASIANILPTEPPHQRDSLLDLIVSEKYCLYLITKPNSIFTRLIIHTAGNIILLHFSKLSLQCSS